MKVGWVGLTFATLACILALATPVSAFHGGPYEAKGTATGFVKPLLDAEDPPAQTYQATLWWSVFESQHYTLEVYDADGNNLVWAEFAGDEDFPNVEIDGCLETADYVGEDAVIGDNPGFPPNALNLVGQVQNELVTFHVEGWQIRNFCTLETQMHYEGTFERTNLETQQQESFSLVLDVWAAA